MELDERKKQILYAVIKTYLETGEPVGSRTISKYADLKVSPATIRNEMADLEELGYLMQPHTSAGRIPSDKGYRFYVDRMLEEKEKEVEEREKEVDEMKEILVEKADKVERLLKQVAKSLAVNTNYATMISAPSTHANKIKFIQLSKLDASKILAVIVSEGNIIKNQIIEPGEELDNETILKLNLLLNTNLNGLSVEEINLGMIKKMKEQAGVHSDIVSDVIDAVAEVIKPDEDTQIFTSGTNNIFKYPELSDNEKASEIISAFEEKQQLNEILTESMNKGDGANNPIQVYIGEESPVANMKDCSVVTATYELGEGMRGTIGIIGPKRMDYDKVVGTLKSITKELKNLHTKDTKKDTNNS